MTIINKVITSDKFLVSAIIILAVIGLAQLYSNHVINKENTDLRDINVKLVTNIVTVHSRQDSIAHKLDSNTVLIQQYGTMLLDSIKTLDANMVNKFIEILQSNKLLYNQNKTLFDKQTEQNDYNTKAIQLDSWFYNTDDSGKTIKK